MKLPSTLDLVIYGLVLAALLGTGAVILHWKHDSEQLKVELVDRKKERAGYEQKLAARDERIAIEIENRRAADESSNRFQGRIRDLEDQRTAAGFGIISVCRRPVFRMPAATAGNAAGGSDAAGIPGDAGAAEVSVDVGPAADLYGTHCEANAIKLDVLQTWVRNRKASHPRATPE